MSTRARLGTVVALVAAIVVAGVVLLAGGAGAPGQAPGTLAWQGQTTVFTPEGLPTDRILTGRITNVALRDVELDVVEVRIADRRGKGIGKVAAARRLLTLVYYGLRDGHIRCLAKAAA